MPFKALILLLMAAVSALSANISTSAYCSAGSIDGTLTVSTGNPCNASGFVPGPFGDHTGGQTAHAEANASFSVSGNSFQGTLLAGSRTSNVASAYSQASITDTLTTFGPVRQGLIIGYYYTYPLTANGGSVTYGLDFPGRNYMVDSFGPMGPYMYVTLGQPFSISAYVTASSAGNDPTVNAPLIDVKFNLGVFEADGITPVALAETPEPATFAIAGFGLLGMVGLGRRFRSMQL